MGKRKDNWIVDVGGPKGFQLSAEVLNVGGFKFVVWKIFVFGSLFFVINWVIENSDDGSGKRKKKKPRKKDRVN